MYIFIANPRLEKILDFEGWNNGTLVTNGKNWRVIEYNDSIGAKYSKESKWLRREESAGVIHGHPITEQEYLNLLK